MSNVVVVNLPGFAEGELVEVQSLGVLENGKAFDVPDEVVERYVNLGGMWPESNRLVVGLDIKDATPESFPSPEPPKEAESEYKVQPSAGALRAPYLTYTNSENPDAAETSNAPIGTQGEGHPVDTPKEVTAKTSSGPPPSGDPLNPEGGEDGSA